MKIAVQGFGNAGYHFARLAKEAGFNVVALSDSKGAIYAKEGLDPEKIMFHRRRHQELKAMLYCDVSVCQEAEYAVISNEALLELDVDVLVLAAMENQITQDNAKKIKAKLVLEIANGPITSEADAILEAAHVTVIPDVLANAGGVTVSYLEWVQNRAGLYWEAKEVNEKLHSRMQRQAAAVFDLARKKSISLRTAAYLDGLEKISGAIQNRGTKEYFQSL